MKSDWKWKFAVQVGLVVSICLSLAVIYFTFVYITPNLKWFADRAGEEFPDVLLHTISVADFVYNWFFMLLTLVVAVVGLFEWKCQSENKTLIRTTMLAGVSLITTAAASWAVLSQFVWLVIVAKGLVKQAG